MAKRKTVREHKGTLPGPRELDGYVPLSEAKRTPDSKGIAEAVIIRHGFNASGQRFYPADVLKRDASIFEGVQMYADHPTTAEDRDRPERSVRDLVGTIGNVRFDEAGDVFGSPKIFAPWLKETLANLAEHESLGSIGLSINAVGKTRKSEIQGRKTEMVEALTAARSVDFVTQAGAGGGITLYESGDDDMDIADLTREMLAESRPDLVAEIQKGTDAMTPEEHKTKLDEAVAAAVDPLQKTLEATTTEKDEALAKIAESDKAAARATAQADIAKLIKEADPVLAEKVQERLCAQFKESDSVDGVAEAIVAERDYAASLGAKGVVTGLGPVNEDTRKAETRQKQVNRYISEGVSKDDAERMATAAGW